jgi:glutamate-1-semialdehyde 2,1-aminomutase
MYPDSHSRSVSLAERARKVLPDGGSRTTIVLRPQPIYVARGEGARVIDVDGNSLLDFNNNYTSLIHGHAHPATVQAVAQQAARGTAFSFATEVEIELAETICQRCESFERIRFSNSGTEAVMTAIKAARASTGRPRIAKCEGAYHGSYDYAEVSLDPGPAGRNAAEPGAWRYAEGTPQAVLDDVVVIRFNDVEGSRRILEQNAETLAAVLIDPLSSRVGMVPPSPAFLAMLRAFCDRHGVLLVFDEVISFRVGHGGYQQVLGVSPDLTALGKIIGGGLPVGALAGRAEHMSVFEERGGRARLPHGGTFNANPLTMAAGLATLREWTAGAVDRLNALGERARAAMREAIAASGRPGQVLGTGSLFRIYLHERPIHGHRDSVADEHERALMAQFHRALVNEGIFIATYGLGCLSTAMRQDDVDRLAQAVLTARRALPH